MANYTAKDIKDRIADGDDRFKAEVDADGTSIVLDPNPRSIEEEGTPVNKDLLQNYENLLEAITKEIDGGTANTQGESEIGTDEVNTKIVIRHDSLGNYRTYAPILARGELAYDTVNYDLYIGDGSSALEELQHIKLQGGTNQSYASSVALGRGSSVGAAYEVAIGNGTYTEDQYSIAIGGYGTYATAMGAISIGGYQARATGRYAICLGESATSSYDYSVAIGYGASTTGTRQIQLGNSSNSYVYYYGTMSSRSDERDKADIKQFDDTTILDFITSLDTFEYVRNPRGAYEYMEKDEDGNECYSELHNKYGLGEYDHEAHERGDKKGSRKRAGISAQNILEKMKEFFGEDYNLNLVNDNLYDMRASGEEIPDGVESQLEVSYVSFIPLLISAMKAQQKEIEELKKKLGGTTEDEN